MLLLNSILLTTTLVASVAALPSIHQRQSSCPPIHIFGARETTASPGFGTAGVFIDLIKGAYPSATTEAIDYPATGGDSYASSMRTGVANIASQINAFNVKCPQAEIVVVGYSQVRSSDSNPKAMC
jgi:acetylxylan esterase